MSRDRFRSRGGGGGGGGGMSIYRRGSNGGRGVGMHNFRGHSGFMEQNRGPPPQQKPPQQQQQQQQHKPPSQQQQPPPKTPTQQPAAAQDAQKPNQNQQAANKPTTPAQTPAASPQTKPAPSPQQKPGSAPPQQTPSKPSNATPQQQQKPASQQPPAEPPKPAQQQPQKPPEQEKQKPAPQQQHSQPKMASPPGKHQQPPQRPRPGPNQPGQKRPFTGQSRFSQEPPAQEQQPEKAAEESSAEEQGIRASLAMLRRPGEKTYTQRCRLFIGNLPADITEEEFKKLFAKYGEPGEVFINKSKGFGFIKLESRALSEIAKAELDDYPMRGRQLRVRFATHSAALSVRNLSPFVSNELLEEAFSQFGPVERAIVIVDDRGRSTGKGIIEFAAKPAARKAYDRCNEGVFLLTTTPMPVIVEPLEQFDAEDGLSEKLAQKNHMYQKEREIPPRFAQQGSFEYEYSKRWKSLDEMEKQQRQQVEKNMKEARQKLESEMDDAYHEHQANLLRQDLLRRQEELRRMEEMHNQEMQKRKEMQLRQEEERRRREEELLLRQRDMEEQMMRQRDDYRMGYMDPREREMRMGTNTISMTDPYSSSPKYPQLSATSMGYEGSPGVTQASLTASLIGTDMRNERFATGNAGTASAQASRGIGSVQPAAATAAGYGRAREDYEGPNKKARF